MISVSSVRLEDLDHEELTLLVRYCKKCFEPLPFEDLVSRVLSGMACIYRFTGDCTGIFILARGDGGLYIETVAGEKIVKNFDALYDKIKTTAAACGARAIYSYVSRPALERLYERRAKGRRLATLWKEDLL